MSNRIQSSTYGQWSSFVEEGCSPDDGGDVHEAKAQAADHTVPDQYSAKTGPIRGGITVELTNQTSGETESEKAKDKRRETETEGEIKRESHRDMGEADTETERKTETETETEIVKEKIDTVSIA